MHISKKNQSRKRLTAFDEMIIGARVDWMSKEKLFSATFKPSLCTENKFYGQSEGLKAARFPSAYFQPSSPHEDNCHPPFDQEAMVITQQCLLTKLQVMNLSNRIAETNNHKHETNRYAIGTCC